MLLIEWSGQCASASLHVWAGQILVFKCQLSSPHRELKAMPLYLVFLSCVVTCVCACVCVCRKGGVSTFDLTSSNWIKCDGSGEDMKNVFDEFFFFYNTEKEELFGSKLYWSYWFLMRTSTPSFFWCLSMNTKSKQNAVLQIIKELL